MSEILTGMQAGVGAVIASVVYEMAAGVIHGKNPVSIAIMLVSFVASCFFEVNVVYIVLICIALGIIRTVHRERRKRE